MVRSFDKLADKAFKSVRKTFNTPIEWLPETGGRFEFLGIFDDGAVMVDPDTEVQISTNAFTLGFRYQDLPDKPEEGDRAVINDNTYKVIEVKEDGVEGVSGVLVLHKERD